jgi:catalase
MQEGAVVHFVGPRIGNFVSEDGAEIEADRSMENSPSVLFDALLLPHGAKATQTLLGDAHSESFISDQFRHGKTILALGSSIELLESAGIVEAAGRQDAGILMAHPDQAADIAAEFITAVALHRHPARER